MVMNNRKEKVLTKEDCSLGSVLDNNMALSVEMNNFKKVKTRDFDNLALAMEEGLSIKGYVKEGLGMIVLFSEVHSALLVLGLYHDNLFPLEVISDATPGTLSSKLYYIACEYGLSKMEASIQLLVFDGDGFSLAEMY